MKSFVFRIRRRYLAQIMNRSGEPGFDSVKPTKDIEYRADSPHWQKLIFGTVANYFPATLTEQILQKKWGGAMGVFICGRTIYRHKIFQIDRMPTPATFSAQGKTDVPTPTCFAFWLSPVAEIELKAETIRKLEDLARKEGLTDINGALSFLLDKAGVPR